MKRLPTNIPGLDLVLSGGLEEGAVVVLAGAPGTGKTIMAQQICFTNATAEHKAIYYTTLSEPHTKLIRHLEMFSFFDAAALGRTVEHIHLGDLLQAGREGGLEPLVSEIVRNALDSEPAIIVIDSAKMLRDFVEETRLRASLYDLTSRIAHTRTVLLLLGEYTPEELRSGVEFSLADGIIQLENQAREPVDRRVLRVAKLRGGSFRAGAHTFAIGPAGAEVFPRIETLLPEAVTPVSGRIPSGIAGLDELMGGGTKRADATLVVGPSGVGKTILGLRFIAEGLEHGERCRYVTFQDTAEQLVGLSKTFGWDLDGARARGQLVISHVPMGNLDLDVLAAGVRAELATHSVGRIVIDSLAELVSAARETDRFPAYNRSLIGLIRAAGTSLLVTSESTTRGLTTQTLGGLMFLYDNVIELRYIEDRSQIGRALNIVKMRNSQHTMDLTSYTITDHGVTIGERIEHVTGVLGWSALRTQDPSQPAATPA
jgi:circadian clock protein KaiC